MKGGLLDQQNVDFFFYKQILSLFCLVMRNLSKFKRPEISWKTKRQKREARYFVENASLNVSSKSVYPKFFWWKRFSTCLMFGGLWRILSPDLKYSTFYFSKLDRFEKSANFQKLKIIPLSKPRICALMISWCFWVAFSSTFKRHAKKRLKNRGLNQWEYSRYSMYTYADDVFKMDYKIGGDNSGF